MIPPRCFGVLLVSVISGHLAAEVLVTAEVVSSDSSASTVRFEFSGDLAGLEPQVNLQSFLFIDFSESPGLKAALPATANLTTFEINTVDTNANSSIQTLEIRNNEAYYFDRIGFVFDLIFFTDDVFLEGSVLELTIPTSAPIRSEDFNNLDLYWCFPAWGVNEGRGTLAGVVNPVNEPASILMSSNAGGQLIIEFTGVLESSPDLVTPFAPVVGATSPYLVPSDGPARYFYRASDE